MSDGSWEQVVEDYKYDQKRNDWGKKFEWMEKLVLHLLENRDLSMLYPITSHYQLITFIGTSYHEMFEKPLLSIKLNYVNYEVSEHISDKFRYQFSFSTVRNDGEFIRRNEESVSGSFEKSLEIFDEMFEKLKSAAK